MEFELIQCDTYTHARAGQLVTDHGVILTPIFMPVGTQATVKGVHQQELLALGFPIILANTYHLYLRPGTELLQQAGGLHQFMNWPGALLTDSGGYQVYSLAAHRKITEAGVRFRSHIDGSTHLLTPEQAMEIQRIIGADIIMAFDECTPFPCSYAYAKASMERTHRWLARCKAYLANKTPYYNHSSALFPIVQGSIYKDLRLQSAEVIAATGCPGNAIGGVCHPTGQLYEVTSWVCERLPKDKPRYLMGVGTPIDILECIACGVDMFDCVLPARNGRNGTLFTTTGVLNIRNEKWRNDFSPLDTGLVNYASNYYSKAYLHHLMRVGERLAGQIATLHNLAFYFWLVRTARAAIIKGNFSSWKKGISQQLTNKL